MIPKMFDLIMEEQLDRCREVLSTKAEEYTSGDRLSNFKKAAAVQGLTLKQALAGMMAKHTVSIYDMIWDEGDYTIEQWQEKITDHMNYLILLNAMLEEDDCDVDLPDSVDLSWVNGLSDVLKNAVSDGMMSLDEIKRMSRPGSYGRYSKEGQ